MNKKGERDTNVDTGHFGHRGRGVEMGREPAEQDKLSLARVRVLMDRS